MQNIFHSLTLKNPENSLKGISPKSEYDECVFTSGVPAQAEHKPSAEFKKQFIRLYLDELNTITNPTNEHRKRVSDANDVNNFYMQTCKCELVGCHIFQSGNRCHQSFP